MKKYLSLTFAALAAVAVQAATVTWQSGDLSTILPSGAADVTAYYVVLNQSQAEVANSWNPLFVYGDIKDGVGTYLSSPSYETVTASEDMWGEMTADKTQTVADDAPTYRLAVYTYELGGLTYAISSVATYVPSEVNPDVANPEASNYVAIATDAAASGKSWTAVPEPTTLALLAIGLAAVGLKRKVA